MQKMNARLRLSVIYTLWASQDHLNLEKYRSACPGINLLEQSRVEIVGACESRNTQQRCSSYKQQWTDGLIEEAGCFKGSKLRVSGRCLRLYIYIGCFKCLWLTIEIFFCDLWLVINDSVC